MALLLIAGSIALASPNSQQQPIVADWSDIEVQKVNAVRISKTLLRLDITYLGKSRTQEPYPFFFHITDQSGALVAGIDVLLGPVSIGKVFSTQNEVRIPSSATGKLRMIMGRFNPVNASPIATINGLNEIEIDVLE